MSKNTLDENGINWELPIKCAADMEACEYCGEPFCVDCNCHYSDCMHPGPNSERGNDQENNN